MITPKQAGKALRSYLDTVSEDEFREDMRRSNPHIFEEVSEQAVPPDIEPGSTHLKAYLASALTRLLVEEGTLVEQMSAIVVSVCKQSDIEVYQPRNSRTDPIHHPNASDADVFKTDRTIISGSDLLILLGDYPSFGAGQELDIAYNALVPILLISQADKLLSRMVKGIPLVKSHVVYHDLHDFEGKFKDGLARLGPVLQKRRSLLPQFEQDNTASSLGNNIRKRRRELGWRKEDVIAKSKLLTIEALSQLEDSSDYIGNPSLTQLRHLADVLETTVQDLLDADPIPR